MYKKQFSDLSTMTKKEKIDFASDNFFCFVRFALFCVSFLVTQTVSFFFVARQIKKNGKTRLVNVCATTLRVSASESESSSLSRDWK